MEHEAAWIALLALSRELLQPLWLQEDKDGRCASMAVPLFSQRDNESQESPSAFLPSAVSTGCLSTLTTRVNRSPASASVGPNVLALPLFQQNANDTFHIASLPEHHVDV